MSIRDSGKLWTWSLTWDDVQTTAPVDAPAWWNPASDLHVSGLPVQNDDVRTLLSAVKHSTSAELLWRYLQRPASEIWTMTAGQLSLWALAYHAVQSEALLERIDALHPAVRAYSDGLPIRARFGLVRRDDSFWAIGVAETDLSPMNENGLRPFLYLHEDARNAAQRRFQWAGALRLFNLLQFLPRTYWLCSTETDPMDFPMPPPSVCMLGDDWDEVLQYLHESARPTALRLRQAGIQAPEVGWDVLRQGRVVVQLEMAWPDRRVGILRENLPDALRQDLTDAGWRLFPLHEIDGGSRDLLSMLPLEAKA